MRAPQYHLSKGLKRASGARRADAGHAVKPVERSVVIETPFIAVTLSTFHKSAKAMGYGPHRPSPIGSLAVNAQKPVPPRQLTTGHLTGDANHPARFSRDKAKSRNDTRWYRWQRITP